MERTFMQLLEVAETLGITNSQAYALVRSGELRAVKIGGRGHWRVEVAELDAYIHDMYAQTAAFLAAHPYGPTDTAANDPSTQGRAAQSRITSYLGHPQPPRTNARRLSSGAAARTGDI